MGSCVSRISWFWSKDMADTSDFLADRTIKVTGISMFLKDAFVKYFQGKDNDFGPAWDVDKVFVCPDDKDCVLVEFSKDQDKKVPNNEVKVKINGTPLTVKPFDTLRTFTGDKDVSELFWIAERPIEIGNDKKHDLADAKSKKAVSRVEKRALDKQHRHDHVDERRMKDRSKASADVGGNEKEGLLFQHTKVKINPGLLTKMVGENQSKTKKMLENEEVDLDEIQGYLTGPWDAVLNVFERLYSFFLREDGKTSTTLSETEALSDSSELSCNDGQANHTSMSVQSLLIRYINAFHSDVFQELENVSKEVRFTITSPSERTLTVVARGDDDELFNAKYNKFIDCYQELYQLMHQEDITFDTNSSANPSIADIISDTRAKFPVIVIFCEETNQITVYGKKNIVLEACSFIKNLVHVVSKEGSKNVGDDNRNEQLMHKLSKKVKLIVYQGDMTEENADAIVNPANEDLHHCGGAAEAILKRGGKTIQDESDDIMKQWQKRLQPGDVEITTGGKLPCKFIVHAVGPRRSNHSEVECRRLLQKAVGKSLKIASKNEAQTIAIPAISSGIFGVPVELCAEVLFDTVEKFAKEAADSENLKEIRFVNIDEKTTQVFQKEMRKRYGDAVSGGIEESNQNGRPTSKEGKNATMRQNPNEKSQQSFAAGHGRGSQDFKENGRKGNNNFNPGGQHPQPNPGVSTTSNSDHSIKHPPSYSNAVTKGLKNPSDNDTATDTSKCSICLEGMTNPKALPKCGHSFCTECIDNAFKHQQKCPLCGDVYGVLTGNQPPGQMRTNISNNYLPGFGRSSTIIIHYSFRNGTQGPNHPNPGHPYTGTGRTAYLPNNKEGQKVLKLLKKAFDQKLTFTIGRSSTTGRENTVTWNDIHHKTSTSGGPARFGYPDPSYLQRVQEELAAKGIKE